MTITRTAPRRIAHVITESEPFGGAQRNTLLTVLGLARDGFVSELICGPGGRLISDARAGGVEVHVVESLVRPIAPLRDARAFGQLFRLFRRRQYDVVHTHSIKAGFLGRLAASFAGVPLVVHTIHGVPFEIDRRLRSRIYLAYERLLAPLTSRVVCVGEVLRQEVAGWGVIPEAKLTTIYSGIDFASYVTTRRASAVKRELGLEDAWPIIGSIGRLTECKSQCDLIDAMVRVRRRFPTAHLLLIGDGELRAPLTQQIRDLDLGPHVRLLGEREDIADLLDVLDVYAMSSRFEGVGRALTEAMYWGLPIVATPVYGVKEMIRDGETGLVVPVQNPEALASAVIRLASDRDLAARLGANARTKAEALMDSRQMVAAIERLYERNDIHVRYRRQAASTH